MPIPEADPINILYAKVPELTDDPTEVLKCLVSQPEWFRRLLRDHMVHEIKLHVLTRGMTSLGDCLELGQCIPQTFAEAFGIAINELLCPDIDLTGKTSDEARSASASWIEKHYPEQMSDYRASEAEDKSHLSSPQCMEDKAAWPESLRKIIEEQEKKEE